MMTIVYLIALVSVVQCAHPPPLGATHVPSETRSRKPLPILQNSNHTCGVDEVKCINGMCILAKWACDTYDDCGDWSDEYSCGPKQNGCPVSRFDCGQGQCISKEFVCDGEKDCANGRDEVHCDKTPCAQDGAFRCQDGDKCLPAGARCDGKTDCQDGADEKDCPGSPVKCQVSQFKCKNGACIDKELVCNNEKDCQDGDDEHGCLFCGENQFACKTPEQLKTTKCIPKMYICDGIKDCQDGADESLPHCAKGPDGTVASHPQADGSQGSSSSASSSSSAEGSKDEKVTLTADDKGDKVQADVPVVEPAYYQCSPAEFMCRNGQCVDRRLQCDRRYDCMDRSDEENCGPSMSAFPDRPESQSMADVDLRVYDTPQTQMVGHDVVFRCRDEGLLRLGVSWSRRDGRPFPPRTSDINGRLTMYNITPSEAGTYVCRVSGRPIEKETYLSVIPRPNYPMGSDFGYPTGRDAGNYPPIEAGELRRALQVEVCGPGQIKCRNGECVPRDAVCNGKVDCKDKSDETSCHVRCKYDEFKCESNQCIRKTNRCDDRLNCLDGSDERNCQKNNGIYGDYGCHYNEFRCASGGQCVPDSYRCDGYFDCSDGSDEQRCQSPRFVKPPVETIQMVEGSTLNLNCTASGEPTPLIVWRYNMDYIGQASNSKITFCTTTCDYCGPNVVIGTITVKEMSLADEGLYTCEAANQMKTVLSPVDTLVMVNRRDNF